MARADDLLVRNEYRRLVALNLPAGSYALFGKASLIDNDPTYHYAVCSLSTGDQSFIELGGTSGGKSGVVVVQDLVVLAAPGEVSMSCNLIAGEADDIKLTAVRIGTVHPQ